MCLIASTLYWRNTSFLTPGAQLIENLQHLPSQFQLLSLLQHISLGMVVHILKSDNI